MTTPRKEMEAPSTGSSKGVVWDRETMERLDRESDEIHRVLQAKMESMRTITPDDLKVRSR